MLVVAALMLRPTAGAGRGRRLRLRCGSRSSSASRRSCRSSRRLPVFSSGHNTRLIALTMLCVALLAGWGLDDVTDAWRESARRRRRPCWGSRLRCSCSSRSPWSSPVRRTRLGGLRRRAARSPGCSPTRRARSATPIGERRHPHVVADHVADAGRRRRSLLLVLRLRGRLRAGAVRRARRCCSSASTSSGRAWASTRRSTATSPRSARRGRSAILERQRPGALRGHRGDRPERPALRVRPVRGARLRPPDPRALRPPVAPRDHAASTAAATCAPCSSVRCSCAS